MATKQEPEYQRKITTKVMLGEHGGEGGLSDKLFQRLVRDKAFPLFNIMGIAKVGRPKTNDYGESVKFIGQFEAESLLDKGRIVRSSTLYLPRFLEEELFGLLGTGEKVTFAFQIGIQYDVKAATKYTYTAKPLVAPTGGDELELLRAQVAGKALPAPKGDK